tara:strand:+ start:214 stop:609 length:396 start_codon:yes stop_codon:yes gene_type:complete
LVNLGDVAAGDIIIILFGIAELINISSVILGHADPTIATIPCVIILFVESVASTDATHLVSALIVLIVFPFKKDPDSEASLKAKLAELAIAEVSDIIGPEKSNTIPIFTSPKSGLVKIDKDKSMKINKFFI